MWKYGPAVMLLQKRIEALQQLITGEATVDPFAYCCLRTHERRAILKELLELKSVLLSVCDGFPLVLYTLALSEAIQPPAYKEEQRKDEIVVCALKIVQDEFFTFLAGVRTQRPVPLRMPDKEESGVKATIRRTWHRLTRLMSWRPWRRSTVIFSYDLDASRKRVKRTVMICGASLVFGGLWTADVRAHLNSFSTATSNWITNRLDTPATTPEASSRPLETVNGGKPKPLRRMKRASQRTKEVRNASATTAPATTER